MKTKMAAKGWSKFFISLAILQKLFVIAVANNSIDPKEGQGLQDYIEQNNRQYLAQIDSYEGQVKTFRAICDKQIYVLEQQEGSLINEMNKIDQRISPLELLSDLTKYCAQQYRRLLDSIPNIRSGYLKCINGVRNMINSHLYYPNYYLQELKRYYDGPNHKTALIDCGSKNNASYVNHTICVMNVISKTNAYFIKNQNDFKKALDNSQCSFDTTLRNGVECVFQIHNNTIHANGVGERLFDDCISGIQLCERFQFESNRSIALNHAP